ncbi:SDR family NAD(P)-dependent oxidoreductase [Hydrogenophaga sp.]|uniref:SDR family NAD(P)-dependent oxidoreductase n=1 Tax=Hydrogenophaga sp. TaxID=1904254 RepID=UPI00272873D3|nr:SDR family oxidoreductase [Hydrogenophaga sp.]MDO9435155.1 SDR family oxidoreductase [Hydrogenophaga sp.]
MAVQATFATASNAPLALVTGASDGLGRAIALELAREGMRLVLADLKTESLRETARLLQDEHGHEPKLVALDLRDVDAMRATVDALTASQGPIGVLVNNAGVAHRGAAIDVTPADWDNVMQTNLRGSFFLSQCVARHLIATGTGGAILNLASTYGLVGYAGRSVYGTSKGALIQLTRMLAIEWAPHGIRVNALAPATVETPSRASFLSSPDVRETLLTRIPLGRFGTPEDVAAAARYLCSSAAGFVTGHILSVDGGLTAV